MPPSEIHCGNSNWLLSTLSKPSSRNLNDAVPVGFESSQPASGVRAGTAMVFQRLARHMCLDGRRITLEVEVDALSPVIDRWSSHRSLQEQQKPSYTRRYIDAKATKSDLGECAYAIDYIGAGEKRVLG